MTTYEVTFERVGRGSHGAVETFEADNSDALAEAVWRYARPLLGSKWFEVAVNLDEMHGSIESGRFGRFSIQVAP